MSVSVFDHRRGITVLSLRGREPVRGGKAYQAQNDVSRHVIDPCSQTTEVQACCASGEVTSRVKG